MLLPMYFLIGMWGGPQREYAAIKFFLYTLFQKKNCKKLLEIKNQEKLEKITFSI